MLAWEKCLSWNNNKDVNRNILTHLMPTPQWKILFLFTVECFLSALNVHRNIDRWHRSIIGHVIFIFMKASQNHAVYQGKMMGKLKKTIHSDK